MRLKEQLKQKDTQLSTMSNICMEEMQYVHPYNYYAIYWKEKW